jgi:hypothetical protein
MTLQWLREHPTNTPGVLEAVVCVMTCNMPRGEVLAAILQAQPNQTVRKCNVTVSEHETAIPSLLSPFSEPPPTSILSFPPIFIREWRELFGRGGNGRFVPSRGAVRKRLHAQSTEEIEVIWIQIKGFIKRIYY